MGYWRGSKWVELSQVGKTTEGQVNSGCGWGLRETTTGDVSGEI